MTIFIESPVGKIAPKIKAVLNQEGIQISERIVGNYRREMESKPNAVWCSDITYIPTKWNGFVYLTTVMDSFSRRIIAWNLTKTMEVEDVLNCIKTARKIRSETTPVIIHTDRGIHYTYQLYKELTKGMRRSYSQKGVPYDNACIESFHSLIKREWLNRFDIQNDRIRIHPSIGQNKSKDPISDRLSKRLVVKEPSQE